MKCPIETRETSELLLAYCARRLDPETAALMERHMETCPACREAYSGQQIVWEALDAWEALPVADDFNRRLYKRIDELSRPSWWQRFTVPLAPALVRRGLPIVAAACLLVVAGAILDNRRSPLGADVAGEVVQAEQVERTLEDMDLLQSFHQEVRAQAQTTNPM